MKKVSSKKLLFLTFLGLILVGCDQMPFVSTSGRYPASSMPPSTECYAPETSVTVQVDVGDLRDSASCEAQFTGKTYYRIRQEVKITDAKIREGEGAHSGGDCGDTYYGGLRWVGQTTNGQKVYWESQNHKGESLTDFILIWKREEKGYHYFDVYLDENVEIPDFVKNCEERGGLIPVIEGFTLPPQIFGLEEDGNDVPGDFNTDCTAFTCLKVVDREPVFDTHKAEFKPYYVKIAEIDTCPAETPPSPACPGDTAFIGTLPATGTEGTKTYNVYYHADTMYLWENSGEGPVSVYNPTENPPPKATGRQPSLQLKAMRFISTATWTWATPECKPVIYLYPEEETRLSIKLDPDGYLTESEPFYGEGWKDLVAYPNGELVYQGEKFDSLHYEAMINRFKTPQQGWVVRRGDLPEFFAGILPRLGLKGKEIEDFQEYWLGRLTTSPYFFVGLLSPEEIERIEPVDFSVEPETFIRIRFYFKDLEKPPVVDPPVLSWPPTRVGFTAVEWGGLYQTP